jgi:hypothetical protein
MPKAKKNPYAVARQKERVEGLEQYLTIRQTAMTLGLTYKQVRRLITVGKIPGVLKLEVESWAPTVMPYMFRIPRSWVEQVIRESEIKPIGL